MRQNRWMKILSVRLLFDLSKLLNQALLIPYSHHFLYILNRIEIGEPGTLTLEDLRRIVKKEEPYYPTYPGSDNAYRDGYITEPPKKPRPSYLFYQGIYRSWFGKRNPGASVSEVMSMMGDAWRGLSEEQQAPYVQMAKEEAEQFEKEKALMERAQRSMELWQPIRRCHAVLERLSNDPMASIFLEPVDTEVFTDYLESIDTPMDMSTVREKLKATKNYMGPEAFARDMRKVRIAATVLQTSMLSTLNHCVLTFVLPPSDLEQLQNLQPAWFCHLACC